MAAAAAMRRRCAFHSVKSYAHSFGFCGFRCLCVRIMFLLASLHMIPYHIRKHREQQQQYEKKKKKLNTNKRTKQAKRSVFLPLNAMLWSNWRVSVRRVFLYTHIFSFWFSSFSIQCAPSDSRKLFSFTYIHMYIQSSISFFTFDKVFIHNFMIFVYTIIPTNSVLFPSFSEPIPHFIPRKLKSCFRWLLCCFLLFLVVVVFLKKIKIGAFLLTKWKNESSLIRYSLCSLCSLCSYSDEIDWFWCREKDPL